jgi:hypothetical protein
MQVRQVSEFVRGTLASTTLSVERDYETSIAVTSPNENVGPRSIRGTKYACALFFYDRRTVGPDTPGAVDAVGTGDGPGGRWPLANDSGTVGPGTSGTVDTVGAGDGARRMGRRQSPQGCEAKHEHKKYDDVFHQGGTFFRTCELETGCAEDADRILAGRSLSWRRCRCPGRHRHRRRVPLSG